MGSASVVVGGDALYALWAKIGRGREASDAYHPLLAHMVDVAQVARAMWSRVVPASARTDVAAELGVGGDAAEAWVAFWAGAHDLGKASPAFARQQPRGWDRVVQAGFPAPAFPNTSPAPHGTVSAWALQRILRERFGLMPDLARQVSRMVGGHHGSFPRAVDVAGLNKNADALGKKAWDDARAALTERLVALLGVQGRLPDGALLGPASVMYLAGLVSVADWIGSNTEFFPFAVGDDGAGVPIDAAYADRAAGAALDALRELGWLGWSPPASAEPFWALFPGIATPHPVQEAVVALADDLRGPSLVVVEAPMGEGKTEAALYLADRWGAERGQRGLYVALPTQATSNQMFGRVRRFLEHRHAGQTLNLQLLHGHAALSAELQALRRTGARLFQPSNIHDEDAPSGDATVVAAEWFLARKRGLLAPFGVGTIDQALLSVLKTRHGFVRLFGLGHKTIVIDEVHAYDTYMTGLLEHLLGWLAALGASVVLLSATLPRGRLAALTAAYAGGRAGGPAAPADTHDGTGRFAAVPAYPRISWVSDAGRGARAVPPSGRATTVRLARLAHALPTLEEAESGAMPPFELGARLAEALADGGCAAVICTTVGRAQRMYAALRRTFDALPTNRRPDLGLFHARFLFGDRDRREKDALVQFGREGAEVVMEDGSAKPVRRPARAVLVATQVIEQSLDLDFDLMVSEPAPADLLLQRLGRLHRHARPDRPSALRTPTLWLLEPPTEDGAPQFERDQTFVYDGHVLLRSWLALAGRVEVHIPGDVEELVEAVYDDRTCPADAAPAVRDAWERTAVQLAKERLDQEAKARMAVIVGPTEGDIFEQFNPQLREDDEAAHESLRALTRLADPSVPVVLLSAAEKDRADLGDGQADLDRVRWLLRRSVTLTHRGLVPLLLREGSQEARPPASWWRNPLLRNHRLLVLDDGDRADVGGKYTVRLDAELGVLIE